MDIQATLDALLTDHHDLLDTRAVLIGPEALERPGVDALLEHLGRDGTWLVAVDENTWEVAGAKLAAGLDVAGVAWARYDVPNGHDSEHPMCDDDAVAAFEAALRDGNHAAGIAVGSGTINDIVKLAAHKAGVPMACVGTAPSMNGYTSKIAAVLSHGVKTTVPCTAPCVVLADLDVMCEAPARMIASGLGDLISKPVSNADWQLSASLNDTFHSAEAMEIIERGAAMLEGVAPKLQTGDREAMAGLVGSLMFSGLAMSVAGSSSPASGGEHLVSHFIDMEAHAYEMTYDFHGCQVGVGTLTTAHFYERLSALDPDTIDVDARVSALPSWEDYDALLRERFGKLYDAVVKHTHPAYPTPDALRARLERLKGDWNTIISRVGQTLRPQSSIERDLLDCDGPTTFAQLGVDPARARRAVTWSKDIRNRYTILHLAWELGVLDEWADEALATLTGQSPE